MADRDFPLPPLAPKLKLARAPDSDGEPVWTLYNPVTNQHYRIDWMSFECLARFGKCKTGEELRALVASETTLRPRLKDIAGIILFLHQNGLLAVSGNVAAKAPTAEMKLWKKILHHYLYFTIPLARPQKFLERNYPKISFLFSRKFLTGMMGLLALMILMTLPRIDEFLHTFTNIFSLEGAISIMAVFAFIKVVHEMAHAFAAVRYGVAVPHMGVAFMVMYPVLYTETSGSWQLSSRKERFHIGMAGITAELCLAAIALICWHIFPAGSTAQTVSFMVVTVSLVGSLLINLNPLMRFDGYYMMCDLTGIDNLQHRATAFARWALRRALFGFEDAPPENAGAERRRFLITFGFMLIAYRFMLFMGIALLVYHIFFQPLGAFLMEVELCWFIGLPLLSELKVWWARRADIAGGLRGRIALGALAALFLFLALPWQGKVSLPAVIHAGEHREFYASAPAQILSIETREGQAVKEGDVLARLESPQLQSEIRAATQKLVALESLRRRAQTNAGLLQQDRGFSPEEIERARMQVNALNERAARMTITAPFDGVIRDINVDAQAGRFIDPRERLFVLINPDAARVSAYASESQRDLIREGGHAVFVPDDRLMGGLPLKIEDVASADEGGLAWPELASTHGGPVASDADMNGNLTPRRALYRVELAPADEGMGAPANVTRGRVLADSRRASRLLLFFNYLTGVIRGEAKIG